MIESLFNSFDDEIKFDDGIKFKEGSIKKDFGVAIYQSCK